MRKFIETLFKVFLILTFLPLLLTGIGFVLLFLYVKKHPGKIQEFKHALNKTLKEMA